MWQWKQKTFEFQYIIWMCNICKYHISTMFANGQVHYWGWFKYQFVFHAYFFREMDWPHIFHYPGLYSGLYSLSYIHSHKYPFRSLMEKKSSPLGNFWWLYFRVYVNSVYSILCPPEAWTIRCSSYYLFSLGHKDLKW